MGAIDVMSRIVKSMSSRILLKSLSQVSAWGLHEATDSAYDRSLDDRLDLINRQNALIE